MTAENLKHAAEPYEYRPDRYQVFLYTKSELLTDIKEKKVV